jgi:flagella basal body P-ring formation protein FlgA
MAMARIQRQRLHIGLCALGLFACIAGAQGGEIAQPNAYRYGALQWTEQALASQGAGGTRLRHEVSVGELDHRLKLAPCGAVDYYLPSGARMWGKTRVGMRCVDGMARWNVFMPVTIKAMAPAWVVKNPLPVGAALKESDLTQVEVDWAEETAAVVAERSEWVGQLANRPLATGQTLRQGMLKPAQVFQAGATVRVVAQGPGFQAAADAQALSVGVVGQLARVRMDNGRVASGLVLDGRTVKIDL